MNLNPYRLSEHHRMRMIVEEMSIQKCSKVQRQKMRTVSDFLIAGSGRSPSNFSKLVNKLFDALFVDKFSWRIGIEHLKNLIRLLWLFRVENCQALVLWRFAKTLVVIFAISFTVFHEPLKKRPMDEDLSKKLKLKRDAIRSQNLKPADKAEKKNNMSRIEQMRKLLVQLGRAQERETKAEQKKWDLLKFFSAWISIFFCLVFFATGKFMCEKVRNRFKWEL